MQQSMNAADNAFMESCFGTVKTELELVEYAHSPEAVRELTEYIRYYNGERRHSSLGYVSPAEFERQLTVPKYALGVSAQREAPQTVSHIANARSGPSAAKRSSHSVMKRRIKENTS